MPMMKPDEAARFAQDMRDDVYKQNGPERMQEALFALLAGYREGEQAIRSALHYLSLSSSQNDVASAIACLKRCGPDPGGEG
jgi:hypothetical protein